MAMRLTGRTRSPSPPESLSKPIAKMSLLDPEPFRGPGLLRLRLTQEDVTFLDEPNKVQVHKFEGP